MGARAAHLVLSVLAMSICSKVAGSTQGVSTLKATTGVGNESDACQHKQYPQSGEPLKPVDLASIPTELRWLGWSHDGDKYAFALTEGVGFEVGGEVYRSDNYGAAGSWRNITGDLPGLMDKDGDAPFFLRGAVTLHSNPRNPIKVLVQGAAYHHWVSNDFGQLWQRIDTPGKTRGYWSQIRLHPTQQDWMLALVRRHECHREESELDKWCASDLFVTQDFGQTWENLTENSAGKIASFVDFEWGAMLKPWGNSTTNKDETIFATVYEDTKHLKGPLPNWDVNVHYVRSNDFFRSQHEKLVNCGNQFDILAGKVYLALPNNCPLGADGKKRKLSATDTLSSSVTMYTSDDEGTTFKEACIPVGEVDLGYRMMSNFFGQGSFIILDHDTQYISAAKAPISNIYSSGGNSSLFSLAMPRAFRRGEHVDFVGIESVPGMYIANHLGLAALEEASFRWQKDITDYEKYVQTRVSFNGGAHWHELERPKSVRHAACDACSAYDERWICQLHLHGPSSYHSGEGSLPGLHSHISAPGIVMAVGNVGEYLDFAADSTCTWLSRDGGETWEDVAEHASVFDFGDSGGILVMAQHQTHGPTSQVHFSMDEGLCWHSVDLEETIDVIGIKVEPESASHVFLVYGQACVKSEFHPNCTHDQPGTRPLGKMYAIDFEEVMGTDWQVCKNETDYERWSVPNEERCLLGRNITITRRKRNSTCFNGKGWQRPEGIDEHCDCDWVDAECDFGYEWSWHERACVLMGSVDVDSCPHIRDKSYVQSASHLRLLNGDVCANVSRIINDTDGRGHSTLPSGGWHLPRWGLIVIALLIAVAVVAGATQYLKSRAQQLDGTDGSSGGLFAGVGNGVAWMRNKVTGQRGGGDDAYFQPLAGQEEEFGLDEEDARSPPARN